MGPLQHPFFRLFRGDKERNDQFRHLIRTQQILPDQFAAAEVTGTGSLPCFEDHLGPAGRTGVLFQSLARRTGFYILFVQVAPLAHLPFHFLDSGNLPAVRAAVGLAYNVETCGSAAVFTKNTKGIHFLSGFLHGVALLSTNM